MAAIFIAAAAAVAGLMAASQPPLQPGELAFNPETRWPWWPGPPGEVLLVFVAALLALGLAAFVRRPRSGVGQALLAGAAANAGSVALWSTISAPDLAQPSASWLAFLAAGVFSLVLWSSLAHLVFVFPTRDRRVERVPALVPLIYLLPQVAMIAAAWAMGALTPTSLEWLDAWPVAHAAIVSVLLVVGIVGIAVRFRSVSPSRRRQVRGIALAVAATAVASLLLIEVPIVLGHAPIVERATVVALGLPIPVFLAVALWRDRGFRLNRLRRSQMALLHAREEERRRLRRDLHDGLGPTLAAIGLKIDAATSWVERDPVKAVQLLHDIRRDLTTTVADTRRLVRGLRPPALDELGLAGAIRGVAGEFGGGGNGVPVIVIEADGLPVLPAAVEVAAFRIAQESLTNAVRHANADQIQVRLALQHDEALRIEVLDDGTGFDPADNAGVGMHAMRERVEELGGDISIGRAPSGGTSVLAILPLSPG